MMETVWGDFDSMALCFTNRLAEGGMKRHVLFDDMDEKSYGVCDVNGFVELVEKKGLERIRPMCCMDRQEFMMLIFIRYRDIVMAVEKDVKGAS